MVHGSVFNCFYTITDPVQAAQYNKSFSISVILWNVLFNLGYMYTNTKFIYEFFASSPAVSYTYEQLGKNIGSFMVRFIYSKFVARDYYKLPF
jgi:putative flippase GtrA